MQNDEVFQFADDLRMASERDPRVDEFLDRRETQRLQPCNLTLRELGVDDVRKRRAAPKGKRLLQHGDRKFWITGGETPAAFLEQRREAFEVQLALRDLQHIAAAARAQPLLTAERLTQPRDVDLERLRRCGGWLGSVEIVDQPVRGDDLTRMKEEISEQSALTSADERHRPTALLDLQFAQDSVFHLACHNRL